MPLAVRTPGGRCRCLGQQAWFGQALDEEHSGSVAKNIRGVCFIPRVTEDEIDGRSKERQSIYCPPNAGWPNVQRGLAVPSSGIIDAAIGLTFVFGVTAALAPLVPN